MDLTHQYCYFFDDAEFSETEHAGFRRRVITGDLMQLIFWRIAGGTTGPPRHLHPDEEQLSIIMRGKLDFRIGAADNAERVVLGPGDLYLAPRNVWHGDSVFIGDKELDEVWMVDVFCPPRDDLRHG